jgi:site-specific DNA-methyltransferase (adenine-specific)
MEELMQIDEKTYAKMPDNIKKLFVKLPNPEKDEVVELFPQSKGQQGAVKGTESSHTGDENANTYGEYGRVPFAKRVELDKSAARFFYCAKASPQDRNDGLDDFVGGKTNDGRKVDADNAFQRGATLRKNTHPTVKPTTLMQYLCKMVTPTGGTVLDPFMGSGSTGRGAVNGGFNFIGIEMSQEYIDIAKARIAVVEKTVEEKEKEMATYTNLFEEE